MTTQEDQMAEDTKTEDKVKKDSQRVGTIKPGSVTDVAADGDKKGYVSALIVNAEGKEHPVRVYGEKRIERFKAYAEAGEARVFSGPLGGKKGETPHVMVNAMYEVGGLKNKAEKAPKEPKAAKEPKVTKTPEERAAARAEANKTRFPVLVGSVSENETISVNGRDVKVVSFGSEFEVDEKTHARLKTEFEEAGLGEIHFEVGAKVAYAKFDEVEPSPAP